jgi:tungstate transport system substrate-binding protein
MSNHMKGIKYLFSIILVAVVLLSACAVPQAPTQAPAGTEAPVMTEAPVATTAPAAPEYPKPGVAGHLVLATTTSTQDSGLLDYLLPMFEQEAGVKVDVIAVGTGQAIQLGKDGNADVLMVHARAQEDAFMAAGDGVRREDVMFNDFVIVGPESDPAGIKGMTSATDAFKKIAETKSPFISRGDKSGTNSKELAIWKAAGIEPAGAWYINAGQGMGEVLTMAEETQAYTLSDRATYLARTKAGLKLAVLVEGDKILFNPYGVIVVDPKKNPNIQTDLAQKFTDWIISVPVQEKIAEFGKADFGQSLFTPDSNPWREAHGTPTPAPASAAPAGTSAPAATATALKITGSVKTPQAWSEEQIKAMKTMQAESTNKQGQKSTYTGVLVADLLKLAEPLPEATTIVFVAEDGFTAEVTLAEALACPNCIISFRDQGGFSTVFPGFPGKLQVKGVVEIQVK